MKLLHIALNAPNSPQTALENALRRFSNKYKQFDWMDQERLYGREVMRSDLVRIAQEFKPDLTFMQIQAPDILGINEVRSIPGFRINWTGDARVNTPQWYFDIGRNIDLTCFSNERDVDNLKTQGVNAAYLQIGFNNDIFCSTGSVGDWPEIVFLGSNYGLNMFPLSELRYEMVSALKNIYGSRFGVYGTGWGQWSNKVLDQNEEAECYRSCKVAINLSHLDLKRYTSDRLFRLMGSGALCLARDYPGITKDFKHDCNLFIWSDLQDLVDHIELCLNQLDQDYCNLIRESSTKLVHEKHTWDYRISVELANILGIRKEINDDC